MMKLMAEVLLKWYVLFYCFHMSRICAIEVVTSMGDNPWPARMFSLPILYNVCTCARAYMYSGRKEEEDREEVK